MAVTIDAAALAAHQDWLNRGARGEGQLFLKDCSLAEEVYGRVNLSFAAFARCELAHTDFSGAIFDEADFEEVSFVSAHLEGASLDHVLVKGGSFVLADLRRTGLREIDVRGADFSRANLSGAVLLRARVGDARFDGADLTDTVLDGTTFSNTSFRDAILRQTASSTETPSMGIRFVDCDLTGVDWSGRDLRKSTFVRCKLVGRRGVPAGFDDDAFVDCEGDFTQTLAHLIGDIFDLFRVARGPTSQELRAKLEPRRRVVTDGPVTFIELEAEHECASVRIRDEPMNDRVAITLAVRDLPLEEVEKILGKTEEEPTLKRFAGRDIGFHVSLRDDHRVFELSFALTRFGIEPKKPATPIALTPSTTAIASLEESGERFEARKYDAKEGAIDVVRYAADGTILEKQTFTWDSEYFLWEAQLTHIEADRFVLEIFCEHWKGATPFQEKFHFRRGT